jgi:transcriptional antiterminator RfaH
MMYAIEPGPPRVGPPVAENRLAWFCVRTHPKHEHIAAAHLSLIQGVEVFNPQLRVERLTRRGRMRVTESLFVNYLFAQFVLETTLDQVRYTPAVKNVVQFGGRVATIPDAVIEELKRTVTDSANTVYTESPLEGDEAEVSVGPFQGEKGVVTRVLPARQRVEVLLDVMGRSLPAEFSLSAILFKRRTAVHRLLAPERITPEAPEEYPTTAAAMCL